MPAAVAAGAWLAAWRTAAALGREKDDRLKHRSCVRRGLAWVWPLPGGVSWLGLDGMGLVVGHSACACVPARTAVDRSIGKLIEREAATSCRVTQRGKGTDGWGVN